MKSLEAVKVEPNNIQICLLNTAKQKNYEKYAIIDIPESVFKKK